MRMSFFLALVPRLPGGVALAVAVAMTLSTPQAEVRTAVPQWEVTALPTLEPDTDYMPTLIPAGNQGFFVYPWDESARKPFLLRTTGQILREKDLEEGGFQAIVDAAFKLLYPSFDLPDLALDFDADRLEGREALDNTFFPWILDRPDLIEALDADTRKEHEWHESSIRESWTPDQIAEDRSEESERLATAIMRDGTWLVKRPELLRRMRSRIAGTTYESNLGFLITMLDSSGVGRICEYGFGITWSSESSVSYGLVHLFNDGDGIMDFESITKSIYRDTDAGPSVLIDRTIEGRRYLVFDPFSAASSGYHGEAVRSGCIKSLPSGRGCVIISPTTAWVYDADGSPRSRFELPGAPCFHEGSLFALDLDPPPGEPPSLYRLGLWDILPPDG